MTNDDAQLLVLTENGSAYLPVVCIHSLENRGRIPLELIKLQTGFYLGEDDIVSSQTIMGESRCNKRDCMGNSLKTQNNYDQDQSNLGIITILHAILNGRVQDEYHFAAYAGVLA